MPSIYEYKHVYGTASGSLKCGKLATKYLWMCGYYLQWGYSKTVYVGEKMSEVSNVRQAGQTFTQLIVGRCQMVIYESRSVAIYQSFHRRRRRLADVAYSGRYCVQFSVVSSVINHVDIGQSTPAGRSVGREKIDARLHCRRRRSARRWRSVRSTTERRRW